MRINKGDVRVQKDLFMWGSLRLAPIIITTIKLPGALLFCTVPSF